MINSSYDLGPSRPIVQLGNNGIMYVTYPEGVAATGNSILYATERQRELTDGKRSLVLIQGDRGNPFDPSIRTAMNNPDLIAMRIATAVVTANPIGSILVNLFLNLVPLPYPVRSFTTPHDAEDWLLSIPYDGPEEYLSSHPQITLSPVQFGDLKAEMATLISQYYSLRETLQHLHARDHGGGVTMSPLEAMHLRTSARTLQREWDRFNQDAQKKQYVSGQSDSLGIAQSEITSLVNAAMDIAQKF